MLDDNQRPKRGGLARKTPDSNSLTGTAAAGSRRRNTISGNTSSVLVQFAADPSSSLALKTPRNQVAPSSNSFNDTLQSALSAEAALTMLSPKLTHAAEQLRPRGEWRTHAFLNFEGDGDYFAALQQRIMGAAPPQCKWDSFSAQYEQITDDANVEQQQRQQQHVDVDVVVDDLSVDATDIDFERLIWVKRLTAAGATAPGSPAASVMSGEFSGSFCVNPLHQNSPTSIVAPVAVAFRSGDQSSMSRPGSGATVMSVLSGATNNSSPTKERARVTAASLASLQYVAPRKLSHNKLRLGNQRGGANNVASSAGVVSLSNSMISHRSFTRMASSGEFVRAPAPPQLHLTEARILALACDLPPGTRVLPAAFVRAQQEQRHPAFFNPGATTTSADGATAAAEGITTTLFIETIMGATTPQSENGISACERAFAGPWYSLFSRWIPTVFFQVQCLERDQQQQQQHDEDDDGLVGFDVLGMLVSRLWVRFTQGALLLHPVLIAQCVRHAMSAVPQRIDMSTAGQLLLDFVVDVFLENVSTRELTALLGAVTALANEPLTECELKHWALSAATAVPMMSDELQQQQQQRQFAWHVDFTSNPALAAVLKIPVAEPLNRELNALERTTIGGSGIDNGNVSDTLTLSSSALSPCCCEHESISQNMDGSFTLVSPTTQHHQQQQQQQTSPIWVEDSFCSAAGASATSRRPGALSQYIIEPLPAASTPPVQSQPPDDAEQRQVAIVPENQQQQQHDDDILDWSAQQFEMKQRQQEEDEQEEDQHRKESNISSAWASVFDLLSRRHSWRPSGRDLVEALTIQIQRALDSHEAMPAVSSSLVQPAEGLLDSASRWDTHESVCALEFPAAGSHVVTGLVFGLRDSWASLVSEASRKQKTTVTTTTTTTKQQSEKKDGETPPRASQSPQRKPPRGPNTAADATPPSSSSPPPPHSSSTGSPLLHKSSLSIPEQQQQQQQQQQCGSEIPVWIHATVDGRSELVTSVGWETLRARIHNNSSSSSNQHHHRTRHAAAADGTATALRRRHAAAAAAASLAETQQAQQQHLLARAVMNSTMAASSSIPSSSSSMLLLDPSILKEERASGITSTPTIDAQSIIRKNPSPATATSDPALADAAAAASVSEVEPAVACFVSLASLTAGAEPEKADIFVGGGGGAQSARDMAERIVRDCNDVSRPESLFCFAFDIFSGAVGEADRVLRNDLVLGDGGVSLLSSLAAAAAVDHGFEWERGLFAASAAHPQQHTNHHQHQQHNGEEAVVPVDIPRLQVLMRVPNEVNQDLDVVRKQKQGQRARAGSPVAAALRNLGSSLPRGVGGSPVRGRSFNDTMTTTMSSATSRAVMTRGTSPPVAASATSTSRAMSWVQRTSGAPRRTPARGAATPDPTLKISARSPFSATAAAAAATQSRNPAGGRLSPSSKFSFLPVNLAVRRTPPPSQHVGK